MSYMDNAMHNVQLQGTSIHHIRGRALKCNPSHHVIVVTTRKKMHKCHRKVIFAPPWHPVCTLTHCTAPKLWQQTIRTVRTTLKGRRCDSGLLVNVSLIRSLIGCHLALVCELLPLVNHASTPCTPALHTSSASWHPAQARPGVRLTDP